MKTTLLFLSMMYCYTCVAQPQWQQCNNGPCNYFIKSFIETPTSLLASGTCSSVDTGATWNLVNGGPFAFCLEETSAGIFAGSDTAIYFSSNGGTSWSTVHLTSGVLNFIYGMAVSGDTVFAASRSGGVLMSPDNGNTWSSVNSGLPTDSMLSILSFNTTLYLGTHGEGIYKSLNSGNSWTAINNGIPANASINNIISDGLKIYASSGYTVYISDDDGLTWVTSPGSPGNINKLAVVGNTLLAGCFTINGSTGVFRSMDQGATWQLFTNGLPVGCPYGVSSIYSGSEYVYLAMESQCGSIYRIKKNVVETSLNSENSFNTPYLLYPNPFSNEIKIINNTNEISQLFLYDLSARLIMNETFQSDLFLNTNHVENGIYIYKITSNSNTITTGKIIKYR